jgi:predicted dehydrogenase
MRAVRFGIAGAGRISARFAEAVSATEGAECVAVSGTNPERAAEIAAIGGGGCRVFASAGEMARESGADIIYIGQINTMHLETTAAILESGRAVICEKPMALTERDARRLISLAGEKGVLLMEAMWTRCLPCYRKLKELVDGGAVGEVKYIRASFGILRNPGDPGAERLFKRELGGGAMFDLGVYAIEFAAGLLGNPVSVDGAAVVGETGVDETSAITMTHPNGAMSVCMSSIVADDGCGAEVCGTKGYIAVSDFYGARHMRLYDENKKLAREYSYPDIDGFVYEVEHARDLILSGAEESGLIPLEDTAACAAVFDAMRARWGTAGC